MQSGKGVYFPGLNALRFFAAGAVIITHVELIKYYLREVYGFKPYWLDIWGKWHTGDQIGERIIQSTPFETILSHEYIQWYHPLTAEAGPLGVLFFFVLSGFLITYLLFTEREVTGSISVRKFYVRRFLRIWPLYYFIVLIGFLVLPHFDVFITPKHSELISMSNAEFWQSFVLFMFIFPNLAMSIFGPFPNIGQLWSIGVEEQFYIGWPWLMKKANNHLRTVLLVIVGIILVKTIILAFDGILDPKYWDIVIRFFAMTKLESMAIGSLGAWALFYKKERILQLVFHPVTQGIAYSGIPFLLYFTPAFMQNGIHLVYSLLFLVIIVNVSTNPKSWLKLEHPILHSLGKISYGLYMYHMLVIVAVIHVFAPMLPEDSRNGVGAGLLFYTASFTISIAISYLSYHLFESRFIRMKRRFTNVSSGDDARIQ